MRKKISILTTSSAMRSRITFYVLRFTLCLLLTLPLLLTSPASAQTTTPPASPLPVTLNIGFQGAGGTGGVPDAPAG